MKIKITLLALVFISTFTIAKAQTAVPNANMELWTDHGAYDDPNFWSTPNALTGGLGAYEVFKDSTNVFDGNYSARLVCTSVIGITVPGFMGTGILNVNIQNQTFSFKGGFPLADTAVTAMIGYYQYTGIGNDSCLFYATLTKWNTSTNQRDTVAVAAYVSGTTTGYVFFAAPFTVLLPETPDTAQVVALTASNYNNAEVGSTLWIDDIDFTNSVGISPVQNVTLDLYPNPADESLRFTMPNELDAKTILVSNIAGTMMKEMRVTSTEINISTASFVSGTYIMYLKNTDGNTVATGKFVVKH